MSRKKKLSKKLLALIITASVVLVLVAAILITNIFIPVKYIAAYMNAGADKPEEGEMRVTFLDVGNGDCTLLELPDGKTALIDGGDGSYKNELKILSKLNSCGIDKIDYIFCTSAAEKRSGGLAEIIKYKKTDRIFAPLHYNFGITKGYRKLREEVKKKNATLEECAYGTSVVNEEYGYRIYALYPARRDGDELHNQMYDYVIRSSVMWISYGGINLLLLGDLSYDDLYDFYNKYKVLGLDFNGYKVSLEDCNIVKAANGGSDDSDFTNLYDLIQADTAIISGTNVGLSLMSDLTVYAGNNIYRTDKNGSVTVRVIEGGYFVDKEK